MCVWSRMRPRMGFALVRIPLHAGVRTHCSEWLALMGSRRSWASLHQHNQLNKFRSEATPPPDLRRVFASGCYRCRRLDCSEGWSGNHRSVRPGIRCELRAFAASSKRSLVRGGTVPGRRSHCPAGQRHARCLERTFLVLRFGPRLNCEFGTVETKTSEEAQKREKKKNQQNRL